MVRGVTTKEAKEIKERLQERIKNFTWERAAKSIAGISTSALHDMFEGHRNPSHAQYQRVIDFINYRNGKYTILIVDDTAMVQKALSRILKKDYEILLASGGKEAVRKCSGKNRPDLVLLDYLMPDMDGIEVFKVVHEMAPDLPVIMITAHASIDLAVEVVLAGCVDFITKPVNEVMLHYKITRALVSANRHNRLHVYRDAIAKVKPIAAKMKDSNGEALQEILSECG